MTFCRPHRLITVLVALFSLLFMQAAMARYVCPASITSDAKGGMSMALDMPCAESMAVDEAQPALCHAHCEAEKLSLDKHELPAPIAISAMPASFRLAAVVPQFSSVALQAPHLMHATAPPVAIRNCCFRI